jgi:hypothetical protein
VGSLLAAALARAQGFLLEPPKEAAPAPAVPLGLVGAEPVQVAVTGLSRGSGASTVAAGLALALFAPGARPAHLVSLAPAGDGPRGNLGPVVRWELPPALENAEELADYGATLARLAGARGIAAVVWDIPSDELGRAAGVVEACGSLVCVAEASAEPVLCALVRDMLAERHGRVELIANRVREPEAWMGHCAVTVPESRLAAALIARGRAPGGAVGEALGRLAALVEERR